MVAMEGSSALLAGCRMLAEPKFELEFQFSGTMNRVCSGGLGRPPSGMTSSTYAIGGVRGLLFHILASITMAFLNFSFLLRCDSVIYQAAPLRSFPLARGMADSSEISECYRFLSSYS
jgi:hypothetical protein